MMKTQIALQHRGDEKRSSMSVISICLAFPYSYDEALAKGGCRQSFDWITHEMVLRHISFALTLTPHKCVPVLEAV